MEQPPGSLDDLQPRNLPTCSVPTLIDLTRKGEECVLNATSPSALPMVNGPGCYPGFGTSNPGLPLSETGSSDITLQSGDQVQPADAFSHTTVTLSYVSRSHVFSTSNSLSQHSPLHTMPPVTKFSLHPPCDSDKGLVETGYAPNQHYLEQTEGPVDLATQTELLLSLSQARVQPEHVGGACLEDTEELCEFNGVISSDGDKNKDVQEEHRHGRSQLKCERLENGQDNSCSSSGAFAESSPETVTPVIGEDEERGKSEVPFPPSKKQNLVVVPDSIGARDLCSLSREYRSPLEDPVSPSATSLDDVEDMFDLPQASSSPSAHNSYLDTAEEAVCDGLSTEGAIQPGSGISDNLTSLDSSCENKQPVCREKTAIEPLIDLTDDVCASDVVEDKTAIPHMNGNAKVLQRTFKKKKLPLRSGRGMRLEAIVMNINSSRYNVSGCLRTNKKASASQSTASDCILSSPKKNETLTVRRGKSRVIMSHSVKRVKHKAGTQMKRGKSNDNTDNCKDSTSDFEIINNSKKSHSRTSSISPQFTVRNRSKKVPEDGSLPKSSTQTSPAKSKRKTSFQTCPQISLQNSVKDSESLSHPDPSVEIQVARISPSSSSKSPKKSQGKVNTAGMTMSPIAKTKAACTPKRRQKKHKRSQSSSIFFPKEPEIKLKYINYKEEKRDLRLDSFSPFVRVERRPSLPSQCTVINYPEETRTQHKKGLQVQSHPSGFISATVPSTSCLKLGRVSMHSQHQGSLVCCLCGQSANAIDLGDLHGPYYPEGYQPSTKTPAIMSGLKVNEDDYSDSDSSWCSIRRNRGRKCIVPPPQAPLGTGAQLKQKGLLGSNRWNSERTSSPAAKRTRLDGTVDVEDWYSPPVLPLEPCEYWLHEDCGVWSAGVFLVKGKVYGLEEAVRAAQEMTCSACGDPGATLGCFFKSCPNKYHYRCALESDCVLIEENFSMKCKKHKNKAFKAPPGNRWDDR